MSLELTEFQYQQLITVKTMLENIQEKLDAGFKNKIDCSEAELNNDFAELKNNFSGMEINIGKIKTDISQLQSLMLKVVNKVFD